MNYESTIAAWDLFKAFFFPSSNKQSILNRQEGPTHTITEDQVTEIAASPEMTLRPASNENARTSLAASAEPTYYNTALIGNVKCQSNLILDRECQVNGSVYGEEIVLSGEVFGDVIAKGVLVLKESAIIHGNVETKQLFVDPGAVVKGNCRVSHLMSQGKNRG